MSFGYDDSNKSFRLTIICLRIFLVTNSSFFIVYRLELQKLKKPKPTIVYFGTGVQSRFERALNKDNVELTAGCYLQFPACHGLRPIGSVRQLISWHSNVYYIIWNASRICRVIYCKHTCYWGIYIYFKRLYGRKKKSKN